MFIPRDIEDIKRIVQEGLQENHQLEFKSRLPESGKNDDLAKDMAAMANTEGGVVIYGIGTDENKRATLLCPFNVARSAERIDLVARASIDEPLRLGMVETILDGTGVGYLVVNVPKSDRAPHFVKGVAWGRTSSGITTLTRREIGHAFSRSTGFSQEFGLFLVRPGQVVVKNVTETHQEGVAARTYPKTEYFLVFENDGQTDVREVEWSFIPSNGGSSKPPSVFENIFPIDVLPPASLVRVKLVYTDSSTTVGL